jgi:hypothetical protein
VITFEVSGADVIFAEIVIVSAVPAVPAACATVIGVVATTPTRAGEEVPIVKPVAALAAALAGATEVNTPKPNAATATSATRLKVVFVDICFLSISQDQEFPGLGFG